MLCFHGMYKLVNRGEIFKSLQSFALETLYDYGKLAMQAEVMSTQKEAVKKYWNNLSTLTKNFCSNNDVMTIQKKVSYKFTNL